MWTGAARVRILRTAAVLVVGVLGLAGPLPAGASTTTAPTVGAVTSPSGQIPDAGGIPVQIDGSGFTNVTAVTFGGVPATSFTVAAGNVIDAVAPPGSGDVDVRVTTSAGVSLLVPGDVVRYADPDTADGYVAVTPTRVLDTRIPVDGRHSPVTSELMATQVSLSGLVPDDAESATLSLTGIDPSQATFLVAAGEGGSDGSSNLNLAKGEVAANQVVVPLGRQKIVYLSDGAGTVDAALDLLGYTAPGVGDSFTPSTPTRVLDTRTGSGAVGPGKTVTLHLAGVVPATATAVSLTLTGTAASTATFLVAYPGSSRPPTSNVNLTRGQTAAAHVTADLGSGQTLTLFNDAGTVQLIADVDGSYGPEGTSLVHPLSEAQRVDDSRRQEQPIPVSVMVALPQLPPTATAAIVNLTAVGGSAAGTLVAHAPQATKPPTSNVNVAAHQAMADLAVVQVGYVDGTAEIDVDQATPSAAQVIVDLIGWTEPRAPLTALDRPFSAGTAGLLYDQTLAAVGGTPPYTWSSGDLPSGLTINGSEVSGTPQGQSSSTVTFTVTDASGRTATEQQTISIGASAPLNTAISALSGVVSLAVGSGATCAVDTAGSVLCAGTPSNIGSVQSGLVPTAIPVPGIDDATAVSIGLDTCALRSTGAVSCWGANGQGELEDGTTSSSETPVTVSGLSDATAIASGNRVNCALRSGGSVVCWGDGTDGLLGDGGTANSSVPVAVSGISSATALVASQNSFCALLADGTVQCWGGGDAGELGNGGTSDSAVPETVPGVTGATSLAGLRSGGCVRDNQGATTCWGYFTPAGAVTAQRVPDLDGNGPLHLVSDSATTCLAQSGDVRCLGSLPGDGRSDPGTATALVQVLGLDDATGLISGVQAPGPGGGAPICAARTSGSVVCWGDGSGGGLGDGTLVTAFAPVPMQVD